ncbi:hypothetical protein, partial [Rhizobium pisi]
SPSANTTGKESYRQKSKTRRKNRRVCQQSEAAQAAFSLLGNLPPYAASSQAFFHLRRVQIVRVSFRSPFLIKIGSSFFGHCTAGLWKR